MYASLLFWLALAFPGYVLVRRCAAEELRSGLLGTLGVSYLATLALLSPVSILCYVVGAPLALFSAACALAVLAAVVELTRRRWWGELGRLVLAAASIELAILVIDLVLGARTGAIIGGDARVHLARIRCLVDHGFNNLDPYVAAPAFFPTYHTNILHALYAACVQLTSVDHLGAWFASLAWGKLLVASGMYYLVWCVFERQWAAWLAAVCVVGIQGPVTFLVYPNKLAPLWVIPCMIGFSVRAWSAGCPWSCCARLGIGSLVLGQLHGLYAIFAVILLAPGLAALGAYRLVRRRPDGRRVLACVVILGAGLPFALISAAKTTEAAREDDAPSGLVAVEAAAAFSGPPGAPATAEAATPGGESADTSFRRFDNGWQRKNPLRGFGAGGWRFVLLAVGIVAALTSPRRGSAWAVVAVVAAVGVVLYVPPVYTLAVRVLGAPWIVARIESVLSTCLIALLVPAVAVRLEPRVHGWVARGAISLVCLALSIPYAQHRDPYDWPSYLRNALAGRGERRTIINEFRNVRRLVTDSIPPGETVLVNAETGMWTVMLHDCHIVAAASSNNGVQDIAQRRADLDLMLADDTPWTLRRHLLDTYGIRRFVPMSPESVWARPPHVLSWSCYREMCVMELNLD